jgi:hypothetical protein
VKALRGQHGLAAVVVDDVEGAGDVVWVGTPGPQRRASPRPYLSETFAAVAAILLRKPSLSKRGLETDLDDPRLLLPLVYEQSQWSAWAAIAAGLAAIFAIADGLAR